MRSKLLMMSTAALLAGTLAAASQSIQPGGGAQDKDKGQQGSSQGVKPNEGTREQAPKGGTQGQVQRDQDKQLKGQTKGQAQSDQDKQKSQTQGQVQRDQDKKSQTQGQAQSDKDKPKGQTQGQVQRDQDKQKGQAERDQDKQKSQTQGQAPRDQDRQQSQAPRDQDRQGQGQQGQGQRDQDRVQQGEREGQRSGNVSVSFTTEQRTKIRETVFRSGNAPRVSNVNFSLNVGTPVPRTVRIVEVPDVIIEVHPEWRGYRYFIVNEELVIVEPDTLKIVAIIDV